MVRPTLEYGSEGNKAQAAALESVSLSLDVRQGPVMRLLDSLQGRRDKMVATMLEHRKLFVQGWIKLRRGKQRKHWCKVVDNFVFFTGP